MQFREGTPVLAYCQHYTFVSQSVRLQIIVLVIHVSDKVKATQNYIKNATFNYQWNKNIAWSIYSMNLVLSVASKKVNPTNIVPMFSSKPFLNIT